MSSITLFNCASIGCQSCTVNVISLTTLNNSPFIVSNSCLVDCLSISIKKMVSSDVVLILVSTLDANSLIFLFLPRTNFNGEFNIRCGDRPKRFKAIRIESTKNGISLTITSIIV